MKKILLIALALAVGLCLPLAAQAKVEFELGGYVRMDAIWNSQGNIGHTLAAPCTRENVANATHGRFQMNASATRFNFTMKGPEVWGGKVTGFIEVDFDGQDTVNIGRAVNGQQNSWVGVSDSSFGQAKLRLRHAMFKINWPDKEVLFGQYWSVNSEMTPETADSGAYCLYGATQVRIPQVRYTQKFTDYFNASLEVASGQNGRWGLNVDSTNQAEGETSEVPMVEFKLRYERDFWGKAAWYGKPRGFYVGLGAGYFRSRNVGANFSNNPNTFSFTGLGTTGLALANNQWSTLGTNNFFIPGRAATAATLGVTANMNVNQMRYHDHWLFLIENFTPIIPTVSKNLAGTLGLAHQWWIGQGVSAWRLDLPGSDRYYTFNGNFNATAPVANVAGGLPGTITGNYDLQFIKRYGGWAQLQYYWTNEIFTNVNFGFEKAFGFNGFNRDTTLTNIYALGGINGQPGYIYANPLGYDPIKSMWRTSITQWYQPVSAVKFAIQYAFMKTYYFQSTTVGSFATGSGNNHSLMANAWYLF